ncbi:ABC transporter substrate-binding protein [Paraclostridium ghonii]|uniref:ABC transporter substrate-binding protein n=1 Tax=Paraclostridium ghonii TaxID=29358 RepID=UPI00202CCA8A|nr:ABC transporter substrate-binding protein [Paeniclostridium ghonii]MCM0167970.1 ABC transporter substrate-binding protein [Paeniclostridium ghonii]
MKRKKITKFILIAALVCSLGATGCTSTKQKSDVKNASTQKVDGGEFVLATGEPLNSINPIGQGSSDAQRMLLPIFECLYRVGNDETRYYLAESYKVSNDNKKITIKLHDKLKWHDGKPITADDLVWNLKIRKDKKLDPYFTEINGKPVDVKKVDNLTVEINLPEPSASYVSMIGLLQMIPSHIYKNVDDIFNCDANQKGIGSGPYKVKSSSNDSLVLERVNDYYRGKPNLETIAFKVITDESAREVAFKNGEISVLEIKSDEQLKQYKDNSDFEIFSFEEGRNNYMAFNNKSAIVNDVKVRQAISLALNKSDIISGAYGSSDIAVEANTVFNPKNLLYSDSVSGYKQDINKSKDLIKETNLSGKKLHLIYNETRINQKNTAIIIQQQLKKVGVDVEIEGLDVNVFLGALFNNEKGKSYDLAINGVGCNGDPDLLKEMFSSKSTNMISSDKLEKLWMDGAVASDKKTRLDIYTNIQQEVKDLYSIYPISSTNIILATHNDVKGLDSIKAIPLFEDYLKIYKVK